VITYIGIDIALMGGAIVTERIFNINGIGNFCTGARPEGRRVCRRHHHVPRVDLPVRSLLVDIFAGFPIRGSLMTTRLVTRGLTLVDRPVTIDPTGALSRG
jgi:hypothetical protein